MKNFRILFLSVAASALVGCGDNPLEVPNLNSPDTDRALATPADVESIIGGAYNIIHSGHYNASDAVWPGALSMGLENASNNANFNMGPRFAMPRTPIANSRGRQNAGADFRDFQFMQRAARSAANGLIRLNQPGFTMGSASANYRARAFAHLVIGIANGDVGLAYDSAAIVNETVPTSDIPPLSEGEAVVLAGIRSLDSAVVVSQRAIAEGVSFETDQSWIPGQKLDPAGIIRLARSYRARFRAQMHRDAASRTSTNWAAIIADAQAGIETDFQITLTVVGAGWGNAWFFQHRVFDNWHQAPYFFYGMADTSRGYDAWLATPLATRDQAKFLIRTPDLRYPQGDTRDAQVVSSNGGTKTSAPQTFSCLTGGGTCMRYIHNRTPGEDDANTPYGESYYEYARLIPLFVAGVVGPWSIMTRAEMDLLAAEGYLRTGNNAAGIALINKYRTRNGLPAIPAGSTLESTVPGGNACVPRVPAAPTFTTTRCGTVFEAMKYEKRLETAYHGWSMWWFDGRGWGDLPEGTALNWPVPQQELDTRTLPLYEVGGVGGKDAAPKGNYGF